MTESLGSPSKETTLNFLRLQLRSNPYAAKELSKSHLGEEIESFLVEKMRPVALSLRPFWEFQLEIASSPASSDEYVFEACMNFYRSAIFFNALVLDAYTLSRVFREFDTTRSPSEGGTRDQPKRVSNVVIYAGNAHAKHCVEFLTGIGFRTLKKSEEVGRKCVSVKNFKPFFSE